MSVSTADNNDNDNNNDNNVPDICANCGKGEENGKNLKACTACKLVKYCNRECQIAHRPQHKKECRRRAAELHDEELFKQPPPLYEDCPICFLKMPADYSGRQYFLCCGKFICSGCTYAPVYDNQGNKVDSQKCPFCRTAFPKTTEEIVERTMKRVEIGDVRAMHSIGCYHNDGVMGFSQDCAKALELFRRAAELGCAEAYNSIGYAYSNGQGVERDKKKAEHYYEIAAIRGDISARHTLGHIEGHAGNLKRALKHLRIAVQSGDNDSLKTIKEMYAVGHATKDDYTTALLSYQTYLRQIKSDQRDEAAAYCKGYKYVSIINN